MTTDRPTLARDDRATSRDLRVVLGTGLALGAISALLDAPALVATATDVGAFGAVVFALSLTMACILNAATYGRTRVRDHVQLVVLSIATVAGLLALIDGQPLALFAAGVITAAIALVFTTSRQDR